MAGFSWSLIDRKGVVCVKGQFSGLVLVISDESRALVPLLLPHCTALWPANPFPGVMVPSTAISEKGGLSYNQQLDGFLWQSQMGPHRRRVFPSGAQPMTRHLGNRSLRWKWQLTHWNLHRKNHSVPWSLEVNVAAALETWPGHTSHTCWPRQEALAGERRWTGDT